VTDWHGLPAGLTWRAHVDADVPTAGMLGDDHEAADMVHLPDDADGVSARAWLRDDAVIRLDVPMPSDVAGPGVPEGLGAPERRLDIRYGLRPLPQGEWIFGARGLALVVEDGRVRHAVGFVPCSGDEYVRRLRLSFAVERRPLGRRWQEGDL
jgi:hypothetical protein